MILAIQGKPMLKYTHMPKSERYIKRKAWDTVKEKCERNYEKEKREK